MGPMNANSTDRKDRKSLSPPSPSTKPSQNPEITLSESQRSENDSNAEEKRVWKSIRNFYDSKSSKSVPDAHPAWTKDKRRLRAFGIPIPGRETLPECKCSTCMRPSPHDKAVTPNRVVVDTPHTHTHTPLSLFWSFSHSCSPCVPFFRVRVCSRTCYGICIRSNELGGRGEGCARGQERKESCDLDHRLVAPRISGSGIFFPFSAGRDSQIGAIERFYSPALEKGARSSRFIQG